MFENGKQKRAVSHLFPSCCTLLQLPKPKNSPPVILGCTDLTGWLASNPNVGDFPVAIELLVQVPVSRVRIQIPDVHFALRHV